MTGKVGWTVNGYGPGTMQARVAGTTVVVSQDTDYPVEPSVVLRVTPKRAAALTLRPRNPGWPERNRGRVGRTDVTRSKPRPASAVARPKPELAPVTTTVRPSKRCPFPMASILWRFTPLPIHQTSCPNRAHRNQTCRHRQHDRCRRTSEQKPDAAKSGIRKRFQ